MISKIEKRREFVRGLCFEKSPKNSFKRLYIVRGCCFWSKKLRFRKNFDANFNAVERVRSNLKIHFWSKGSILKERKKERLMQELNFIGWTATEGMEANHDCTILWYKKSMLGS